VGVAGFFWGRRAYDARRLPARFFFTRNRTRASVFFALFGACIPSVMGVDHCLSSALGDMEKDEVQRMLELPSVMRHLEGVPESEKEAALRRLLTQGLALLPAPVLAERVALQAEFLRTLEPEPCKQYLEGTLPPADAARYREVLSRSQQARWEEIKFLAVELPLTERAHHDVPTADALTKAYLTCLGALPRADAERLAAGLQAMGDASPEEACWVGLKLHEAILLAPLPEQALMARKLFNP
jgi:hypothetical protein